MPTDTTADAYRMQDTVLQWILGLSWVTVERANTFFAQRKKREKKEVKLQSLKSDQ